MSPRQSPQLPSGTLSVQRSRPQNQNVPGRSRCTPPAKESGKATSPVSKNVPHHTVTGMLVEETGLRSNVKTFDKLAVALPVESTTLESIAARSLEFEKAPEADFTLRVVTVAQLDFSGAVVPIREARVEPALVLQPGGEHWNPTPTQETSFPYRAG